VTTGDVIIKPHAQQFTDLVLEGNLENTTDFRKVYATLIEEWMGADSSKVLGEKFKTMGMFRTSTNTV